MEELVLTNSNRSQILIFFVLKQISIQNLEFVWRHWFKVNFLWKERKWKSRIFEGDIQDNHTVLIYAKRHIRFYGVGHEAFWLMENMTKVFEVEWNHEFNWLLYWLKIIMKCVCAHYRYFKSSWVMGEIDWRSRLWFLQINTVLMSFSVFILLYILIHVWLLYKLG